MGDYVRWRTGPLDISRVRLTPKKSNALFLKGSRVSRLYGVRLYVKATRHPLRNFVLSSRNGDLPIVLTTVVSALLTFKG
jgi:hypothetical protein